MPSQVRPTSIAQVVQALATTGVIACILGFMWLLLTTRVNLSAAGKVYLVAMAIVALAGLVSLTVARAKADKLQIESYRTFIRGPLPHETRLQGAWRWGRIAINAWIFVLLGLLVFGFGLQTVFRQ